MAKKYNIASRHMTTTINGQLYMVDYPDASDMAGLLAHLLKTAPKPLPLDVWKRYTAGQREIREDAYQEIRHAFPNPEDADSILAWKERQFLIRRFRKDGSADLVLSTALDLTKTGNVRGGELFTICSCDADGSNEKKTQLHLGPVGIRPVLVPLDPNGEYACERMKQINQNGTVMLLGSLYQDGELMPTITGSIVMSGHPDFCIDETGDDDSVLTWICWEGKLIANHNFYMLPPNEVTDMMGKLIP